MKYALRLANHALHTGETPVACVFVYNGQVISYGMNNTNDSLSGINHAEFRGINMILDKVKDNAEAMASLEKPENIFSEIDLYVTVEPCVMCASALKHIGIRAVYFGCGNDRFGGNGSVFHVNADRTLLSNRYRAYPGILRKEAITLLRNFYVHENTRAPTPRDKKNRKLNTESFPELMWGNYITREEFLELFGEEHVQSYDDNLDVFDEVDQSVLDRENIEISDIIELSESPLLYSPKKRRVA
jgi:tRNA-specific adenosine deaminase 2